MSDTGILNTDYPGGSINEFNIKDTLWTHLKSGKVYKVVSHGFIESTQECVIIYHGVDATFSWVRPFKEFMDGRFELRVIN